VQDWFCASKDNAAVTVSSSVAVFDWVDALDSNSRQTVLQPILFASRRSCHWEGNYYLQAGNHHFEFTLTSSPGEWKAAVFTGKYQNQPLRPLVVEVPQARAGLPSSYSFAGVNADNLLITTIKKSEDENSIVMRFVDMLGKKAEAKIDWFGTINGVTKTNIIEEEDQPITKAASGIGLTVTPYSIETIRIR
jgi:alpha-mannosidase